MEFMARALSVEIEPGWSTKPALNVTGDFGVHS